MARSKNNQPKRLDPDIKKKKKKKKKKTGPVLGTKIRPWVAKEKEKKAEAVQNGIVIRPLGRQPIQDSNIL
jgi:hypothetical protein